MRGHTKISKEVRVKTLILFPLEDLLLMVAESPSSIETVSYLITQVRTSARVVMVSSKSPCAQLPVPRACPQPGTRHLSATSWKALGGGTHATRSRQPGPSLRVSRATPRQGKLPSAGMLWHTQYGEAKRLGKASLSLPQDGERVDDP